MADPAAHARAQAQNCHLLCACLQFAAEEQVARLERLREGQIVDIQHEMALVTLDVLGRTIFSDGLGRNAKEVASAISRLLATAGRIDPFDILNFPEWVPRFSKIGGGPLRIFLTL